MRFKSEIENTLMVIFDIIKKNMNESLPMDLINGLSGVNIFIFTLAQHFQNSRLNTYGEKILINWYEKLGDENDSIIKKEEFYSACIGIKIMAEYGFIKLDDEFEVMPFDTKLYYIEQSSITVYSLLVVRFFLNDISAKIQDQDLEKLKSEEQLISMLMLIDEIYIDGGKVNQFNVSNSALVKIQKNIIGLAFALNIVQEIQRAKVFINYAKRITNKLKIILLFHLKHTNRLLNDTTNKFAKKERKIILSIFLTSFEGLLMLEKRDIIKYKVYEDTLVKLFEFGIFRLETDKLSKDSLISDLNYLKSLYTLTLLLNNEAITRRFEEDLSAIILCLNRRKILNAFKSESKNVDITLSGLSGLGLFLLSVLNKPLKCKSITSTELLKNDFGV